MLDQSDRTQQARQRKVHGNGTPQWASLDQQGCVVGFPEQSHIGYSTLAVTATDGETVLPNEGYLFVFDSRKKR
ncbi:MAG: hypothetical protein R3B54_11380 [Bdellovibrionota bacterium]